MNLLGPQNSTLLTVGTADRTSTDSSTDGVGCAGAARVAGRRRGHRDDDSSERDTLDRVREEDAARLRMQRDKAPGEENNNNVGKTQKTKKTTLFNLLIFLNNNEAKLVKT